MDQFKYESLNLERLAFRLVRLQGGVGIDIECELIHTTLDENGMPYEAVSYTWGSTKRTEAIYMGLQRTRLDVTGNLLLILHDLRYPDRDRYLWIDAICINQDDVRERGHQVQQMKHIYSDAERVLFCVGRPTELTRVLMTSLADLQKIIRGVNWNAKDPRWNILWEMVQGKVENEHHDLRHRQRQALEYLLGQSWFRRVWILQEVGNAKAATVYCGRESVLARIFAIGPQLLGIKPNSHCQAVLDLMPGPSRKHPGRDKDRTLYSLLQKFSNAEAQDERDRVYGLLGMCTNMEGKLAIVPDYNLSVREVIHQVITHVCFCDVPHSVIGVTYADMDHFLAELPALDSMVLRLFANTSIATNIQPFLQHRGLHFTMETLVPSHGGEWISAKTFFSIEKYVAPKVWNRCAGQLLIPAAVSGDIETARLLLHSGANIEARKDDWTPLHHAALKGHLNVARLFLQSGANIKSRQVDGGTPLQFAARGGHLEVTRLFLQSGAEIEARQVDGSTPLHTAASNGRLEVTQLLLQSGADIEAWQVNGRTPLHSAASNGHLKVIRLLLQSGANIKAKTKFGETPLSLARSLGRSKEVQSLLNFV